MRTFLTTVAAIALLASPIQAATHKVVWNQSVTSEANVAGGAFVTLRGPHICLADNESDTACWNDHDRPEVEEEEEYAPVTSI